VGVFFVPVAWSTGTAEQQFLSAALRSERHYRLQSN
jgi:hypothetical protein